MNRLRKEKTNTGYMIHYTLIQALYWFTYCTGVGFTSVLLLDCGYSNSSIGLIMAVSNIIAFILQPVVADFADRHSRIELKNIVTAIVSVSILLATALVFLREKSVLMSVIMTTLSILVTIVQPLVNSLSVVYEKNGVVINFGLTRSGGSLTYAVISMIMGVLLKWFPTYILPATTAIFFVIMVLVVYNFKRPCQKGRSINRKVTEAVEITAEAAEITAEAVEITAEATAEAVVVETKSRPLFLFMKENKRLMLFIFGVVMILYNHILVGNYMIQIISSVGGDSSHMGLSAAIAAVTELPAMILFNRLRSKFGCSTLLRVAIAGFIGKNAVIVLAGSVGMVYLAQAFQFISFALFIPAVVYYVSKISGPADAVKGQSLFTSACTLAGIFASLIGGWLLDTYSAHTMVLTGMAVTIAGAVVVNLSIEKVD